MSRLTRLLMYSEKFIPSAPALSSAAFIRAGDMATDRTDLLAGGFILPQWLTTSHTGGQPPVQPPVETV